MKLTLLREKGRKQWWDLDGKKISSLAGDGHCEATDPVVADFIRGEYDTQEYPKVGETIILPERRNERRQDDLSHSS